MCCLEISSDILTQSLPCWFSQALAKRVSRIGPGAVYLNVFALAAIGRAHVALYLLHMVTSEARWALWQRGYAPEQSMMVAVHGPSRMHLYEKRVAYKPGRRAPGTGCNAQPEKSTKKKTHDVEGRPVQHRRPRLEKKKKQKKKKKKKQDEDRLVPQHGQSPSSHGGGGTAVNVTENTKLWQDHRPTQKRCFRNSSCSWHRHHNMWREYIEMTEEHTWWSMLRSSCWYCSDTGARPT